MPVVSVLPSSKCHKLSEDGDGALSYEFVLHGGQLGTSFLCELGHLGQVM